MVIHLLVNLVAMKLVQATVGRNHICRYSQNLKAISVKVIHSFPEGAKQ